MSGIFIKLEVKETKTGIVEVACVHFKLFPRYKELLEASEFTYKQINEETARKLLQDRKGFGVGCYSSTFQTSPLAAYRRAQAIKRQASFNLRIGLRDSSLPHWIQA